MLAQIIFEVLLCLFQEDATQSDTSRLEQEKVVKKLRAELSAASDQLTGMQSVLTGRIEESKAAQEATSNAAKEVQALQVRPKPLPSTQQEMTLAIACCCWMDSLRLTSGKPTCC